MRRAHIAEIAAWWAFLLGLWCTFIGNITSVELACGAAAGLIAAMALGQLRWMHWPASRPRARWLGWLPTIVAAAVVDTARLVPALLRSIGRRGDRGTFRIIRLAPAGTDRWSEAQHSYATGALSATPGSYVVETYPEAGEARVHTLVDGRPDLVEKVNA
jgi:multisubunit Na+/H+ antiporter MnhE subunit